MKNPKKLLLVLVALLATPLLALAHQPRLPDSNLTLVENPEISKAYYHQLSGETQIYKINSEKPFTLYINLLVPDLPEQKKDVSAVILKTGQNEPISILDGLKAEWAPFFEKFGHDHYWIGPEYKAAVDAGEYEIRISSPASDSKYSLAIGEIEIFDLKETLNALKLVPKLKRDFFNESPISFLLSPFGWGMVLLMFFLSFVFGLLYRMLLRMFAKKMPYKRAKNMSSAGRLLRFALGIGLFFWAITSSWSLFLLFASGFCFFEAIFSWCGLYAALGKSTCPLN